MAHKQFDWYWIWELRAEPPGLAAAGSRRKVLNAALQQLEELATAARGSGAASRPLLLFYAISQGTRAIAAAHLQSVWELRGHGLSQRNLGGDLLRFGVDREPRQAGRWLDSFGAITALLDDPVVERLNVGELWASLPEIASYLPDDVGLDRPLRLVLAEEIHVAHSSMPYSVTVVGLSPRLEAMRGTLQRYPGAQHLGIVRGGMPEGVMLTEHTAWGTGVPMSWGRISDAIPIVTQELRRQTIVEATESGTLWLRPRLQHAARPLSTFSTWWALLYLLSLLARYEPSVWLKELNRENRMSPGLHALLDLAVERVPDVVEVLEDD